MGHRPQLGPDQLGRQSAHCLRSRQGCPGSSCLPDSRGRPRRLGQLCRSPPGRRDLEDTGPAWRQDHPRRQRQPHRCADRPRHGTGPLKDPARHLRADQAAVGTRRPRMRPPRPDRRARRRRVARRSARLPRTDRGGPLARAHLRHDRRRRRPVEGVSRPRSRDRRQAHRASHQARMPTARSARAARRCGSRTPTTRATLACS